MNWIKRQNLLKIVTVFTVGFGLLFCCGAAWYSMVPSLSVTMDGHEACGMTDTADNTDGGHNYMVVNTFIKNLLLVFVAVFVFVIFTTIKNFESSYYYRDIRDRYGGFHVFNYFINIFGVGILNPKTF